MLPPNLQALYHPSDYLYHPATEDDVTALVQYAVQNKLQIRVRGAAQSEQQAVFTDGYNPVDDTPDVNLNLELDQLRIVSFDDATLQVTVGAGCNLGYNPFDPAGVSQDGGGQSAGDGLLPQLARKGWVIPNVPTVIHQTIAGFLATGSSGSSLTYSFDEHVVAIRLVDGTGTITTYQRTDDLNDRFYAIGTSMGLLGIVVSVTLQCLPALDNNGYKSANVVGWQVVTSEDNGPFDFQGAGNYQKPSLEEFFRQNTYTRLLWWPYKELRWLMTWYAQPMSKADEPFVQQGPKPYEPPFPALFSKLPNWRLPAQVIASVAYWLVNNWPDWFDTLTSNYADEDQKPLWDEVKQVIEQGFPEVYPKLVSWYFGPQDPPQHFWDVWWKALPMDTVEFSNKLFDLNYTELWVNVNQTQVLIDAMDNHYKEGGLSATGTYTVEISAAKKSDFWLSPAYGYDVIRINIFSFANGIEPPETYFTQFWKLLPENQITFRPHWGKMLPPADGPTGVAYLARQYPKWDDFMKLRAEMDPHNVFLTDYWKTQLGVGTDLRDSGSPNHSPRC